jgi:hypothetical protein
MDVGCEALREREVTGNCRENGLLAVWENEDWRKELHAPKGMLNTVVH